MPRRIKRPQQELRPHFYIYCEGSKTEPFYLNQYIQKRFPGTRLIEIVPTKKSTARELVREACKAIKRPKKESPKGDVFWVVYDRECPAKYADSLHVTARQIARGKVNIALSNVCFEVWLLLHFQPTCKAHDSYDDLRAHSRLTEHIPGYDKASRREYTEEIARARQHAERMNASTKSGADREWTQPHQWNPYTDVHKLLDAMDEFGRKHIERKP